MMLQNAESNGRQLDHLDYKKPGIVCKHRYLACPTKAGGQDQNMLLTLPICTKIGKRKTIVHHPLQRGPQ